MKYYVEWKLSNGDRAVVRTEGSMLKKDAQLIETMLWNFFPIEWVKIQVDNSTS